MCKLRYRVFIALLSFIIFCIVEKECFALWSQMQGFKGEITQGVACAGKSLNFDSGKKYKFVVTWEPKEDEVMLWLRSENFYKGPEGQIGESYLRKTDTGGKLETEWTCTTNNTIRMDIWAPFGNKFQIEIYVWSEESEN